MIKDKKISILGDGMSLVRGGFEVNAVATERNCTCSYHDGKTNDATGKKEKDGCACGCWGSSGTVTNDKANDKLTPDQIEV